MSIKRKQKIIKELAFQYCKLLNNPYLDQDFFKNMADETYRKFGRALDSKKDLSKYYDFAINDLKQKINNLNE